MSEDQPVTLCGAVHPESPSTHCERQSSHGGPHRSAGVIWERMFTEQAPVPEVLGRIEQTPGDPGIATIPTMITSPEFESQFCQSFLPSLWKDGERVQCQKRAGHEGEHRYEAAAWMDSPPELLAAEKQWTADFPHGLTGNFPAHSPVAYGTSGDGLRASYIAGLIEKAIASGDPDLLDRVERLLGLARMSIHVVPPE